MDDVDGTPTANIPPKLSSKSAEKKDWLYKCATEIIETVVFKGFQVENTEDDEEEGNVSLSHRMHFFVIAQVICPSY